MTSTKSQGMKHGVESNDTNTNSSDTLMSLVAKLAVIAMDIATTVMDPSRTMELDHSLQQVTDTVKRLHVARDEMLATRRAETIDETSIIKRRKKLIADRESRASLNTATTSTTIASSSTTTSSNTDTVDQPPSNSVKSRSTSSKASKSIEKGIKASTLSKTEEKLASRAIDSNLSKGTWMEGKSLVEVLKEIHEMIEKKRELINESNRREFLRPRPNSDGKNEYSCARVDAVMLNRSLHIRHHQVANTELHLQEHQTKLARNRLIENPDNKPQLSNTQTSDPINDDQKKNMSLDSKGKDHVTDSSVRENEHATISERLTNVEEHLNVHLTSGLKLTIHERLKVLEDRIMELEDNFPAWSAFFFNQQLQQGRLQDTNKNMYRSNFTMPTESLGRPPQTVVYRCDNGELMVNTIPDTRVEGTSIDRPNSSTSSTETTTGLPMDNKSIETGSLQKSEPKEISTFTNPDGNERTYNDYETLELRIQHLKQSLLAKMGNSA